MNNPIRYTDPTGNGTEGDIYSNKGKFIASDGLKDNKIYVLNSDKIDNTSLDCNELKSKSTEVKQATKANIENVLKQWAQKYQEKSSRYSNDENGDREFAMNLFKGNVYKNGKSTEVFAEGTTGSGNKGIDGVSLTGSTSMIENWGASESIHTHRWGSIGDFSDDSGIGGYFQGDIQTSVSTGRNLYLVVPYAEHISIFNPKAYSKDLKLGMPHETAKLNAITKNYLKIR